MKNVGGNRVNLFHVPKIGTDVGIDEREELVPELVLRPMASVAQQ